MDEVGEAGEKKKFSKCGKVRKGPERCGKVRKGPDGRVRAATCGKAGAGRNGLMD